MAVTWLPRLPIPLIKGYSNIEQRKVRKNPTETGPARFELLSEHGPTTFNVIWLFTPLEFQLFEGFWKHELTFGSKAFDMELLVGAGLKSHELYFDKSYKPTLVGKKYKVSAMLHGIDKQYDTLSDYNNLKAANP
jgi:hypothetical protein